MSDLQPSSAQWKTRFGFILASAGSAIGLGALWKFPFWAGANGGGTFILLYIFFTLTVGSVLVMAEIAAGRRGRGSVVSAMRKVGGKPFGLLGALSVVTSFAILSYYAVVGGWCVSYLVNTAVNPIAVADANDLRTLFGSLVSTEWQNVSWLFVFLLLTCATVALGIEEGIERLSKYLMPMLFVLMICLTVRGLMLPGALKGVQYLFDFSFANLTPAAILNAMGFTFFSLSLGTGILVTYGAYLPKSADIAQSSLWVVLLSVQASLLSGLMIMPSVFAFGLEPNAGPGLAFITLPLIFSQIPFGSLFGVIFYACLLVAALTSAVSMLEVVVAYLQHGRHYSRSAAVTLSFCGLFILGCVSALSFGRWSSFTILGRPIFDFLDYVCTNFLMPAGGLAIAVLMGWKAWRTMSEELQTPSKINPGFLELIGVLLKYLAPLLVLVAFYQGIFA